MKDIAPITGRAMNRAVFIESERDAAALKTRNLLYRIQVDGNRLRAPFRCHIISYTDFVLLFNKKCVKIR